MYLDTERPADAGTDRLFVVLKGARRGRPLTPAGLDRILESRFSSRCGHPICTDRPVPGWRAVRRSCDHLAPHPIRDNRATSIGDRRTRRREGAARTQRPDQYQCHHKGCVKVDKAELDDLAQRLVIEYLSRSDVYESLRAAESDSEELTRVRDEVAIISAELDELAGEVAAGRLSARLAAAAEPGILARLDAAREREAELTTPSALAGLVGPGEDIGSRWATAPVSARRAVIRLLFSPDLLGVLQVLRSPTRGHRCPIVERIRFHRSETETRRTN
jgi:hypothetical protein